MGVWQNGEDSQPLYMTLSILYVELIRAILVQLSLKISVPATYECEYLFENSTARVTPPRATAGEEA